MMGDLVSVIGIMRISSIARENPAVMRRHGSILDVDEYVGFCTKGDL
jgi:hypothetical protein